MTSLIPLFKSWVPQWLIKIALFIVFLPSLVLLFLPLTNINAAAGYYGSEPADIQFSVVLFYAGYASFYSLEKRFFSFLAAKEYFFIFTLIQIITSYICYSTQNLTVLFSVRFIQGMCLTSTANLSLSLIYNRLKSERAREIGYSIFSGTLVCMIPFNNFITAGIIDSFNYNTLYKCAMFSYVPCLILLAAIMNNVRLNIKFPLYLLDWPSFSLYAVFLCLTGYILVYGQEYYWFTDNRILFSAAGIILFLLLFLMRQRTLKRPYFQLEIFNHRNFKVGILILFIFNICRFTAGLTPAYFSTVLGLDPIHVSYLNLFNILGIVTGVIISCVMVLQKRPARLIWIYGFVLLLVYHAGMFFLLDTQANENIFFVPQLIQGLGAGILVTPIAMFIITSVSAHLSATAAGISLFTGYLAFCSNFAMINFYELFRKSKHYNTFQDQLTKLNPIAAENILKQSKSLIRKGVTHGNASKIADKLLVKHIAVQGQIRFTMDYYEMISWILLFTILLVALFPYVSRTVIYLRSDRPAPF